MMWNTLMSFRFHLFHRIVQQEIYKYSIDLRF